MKSTKWETTATADGAAMPRNKLPCLAHIHKTVGVKEYRVGEELGT